MANADKHKVTSFNGPSYGNDSKTGISKFYLVTPESKDNVIILTGLLNEMPEFSISVNYEDGPGATWQDNLMSFMTSDIMQMATMIGSANGSFNNLLKMGTWTKKIYAGYKPGSISLNFRVYESDTLGQSSIKEWIYALNNYATIDSKNEFSIKSAFENIGHALHNMTQTGNDVSSMMLKNFIKTDKKELSRREEFNEREKEVVKQVSTFNRKIVDAIRNYNNNNQANVTGNIAITTEAGGASENSAIVNLVVNYDLSIPEKGFRNNFSKNGIIKNIGSWKNPIANDDTLNTADPNSIKYITISEIFSKIRDNFGDNYITNEVIQGIEKEYNNITDDGFSNSLLSDKKALAIYNALNTIADTADNTGNLLVAKYDDKRVFRNFNKDNGMGERLWHLVLYPDVFFSKENPLIVYISNWEIKYSEETSESGPIYCDFKITCNLDQIYSRAQWYKILAPKIRDVDSVAFVRGKTDIFDNPKKDN